MVTTEEKTTTTWWEYSWGEVKPFEVVRETAVCLFYLRHGQETRMNRTSVHFRTKKEALEYGVKRMTSQINVAEKTLDHYRADLRKLEQQLSEVTTKGAE